MSKPSTFTPSIVVVKCGLIDLTLSPFEAVALAEACQAMEYSYSSDPANELVAGFFRLWANLLRQAANTATKQSCPPSEVNKNHQDFLILLKEK
jgi:hypothetical protein